ncbi:hypothetical protein K438DRAFT_2022205 [Mycena galopus ATCC 62051]|nr:hypothetical protein K438DRAFT_2022205 [Mycena galopus ATCC 62051]
MPSLSDLPTEILIEIVGYYPQLIHGVPIADRFTVQNPLNAGPDGGVRTELFDGNNTLRALSQTSRALRGVFLPVLWARVHACFTKWNMPKGKVKRRAKMLERRMIGIQKTPYIVPYIHSLTVTLMECGMGNWQPIAQFIRVLTLLQNLRDLTVLRVPNDMVPVFDSSCRGKVFPSVQRLALDDHLAPILPSFPNIHTLTFPWSDQSANVLSSIKASCKRIHTLNHFRLSPRLWNSSATPFQT